MWLTIAWWRIYSGHAETIAMEYATFELEAREAPSQAAGDPQRSH
jgi:hypothetical protein